MIGFHYSNTVDFVSKAQGLETKYVQIMIRNPRKINSDVFKYDTTNLKKIKIFTHAPYTINLLNKTSNNKLYKHVISALVDEMKFMNDVNGKGCVIHTGTSTKSFEEKSETLIQYLLSIIKHCQKLKFTKINLILENRAKAGNLFLSTYEEMINFDKILSQYPDIKKYVSYCYDTCHAFVSINKDNKKTSIDKELQQLLDNNMKISVIHLNDSQSTSKDLHANLFDGIIPKHELINTIKIANKHKIPMIVERIDATEDDKKTMLELVKKLV